MNLYRFSVGVGNAHSSNKRNYIHENLIFLEFNQIHLCEVDSIFTHIYIYTYIFNFFFQVQEIIHPHHEYILRDPLYELNSRKMYKLHEKLCADVLVR